MCIYNHNLNNNNENILKENELIILKKIYKCIDIGDINEAKKLTNDLIQLQDNLYNIKILTTAYNLIK
ncbi:MULTISPECIES: hypothetical protein [Romboutsia]|uniref:hypothetical protein n=1 Tax=Romboutsia TaxID=1501226 RepID=UPI000B852AFD|nr:MULTISPECIES: hypothetical protein [Romboutsia]MCH1960206.1 hypothetical protein [Romboutsia hominis]MCH1969359.1 hypothetical protein [Romboutsia hominis]MDB8791774.1 hypothetical protein [Romboutsia sp. 1001216sp1]MDB8794103.1 hypothetical protein [Romboutsia sp. 1001216sp1]MDB8796351.1 hypothetical protein [Romboutsia sp. 1001216sp1]